MNRPKIWIALDVPTRDQAESLMAKFPGHRQFKVGLELFSAIGPEPVQEWIQQGWEIFLDLKLHDIPHTVSRAVNRIEEMGVSLTTVHASGGMAMMQSLSRRQLAIVGVTLLTSLGNQDIHQLGFTGTSQDFVINAAQMCKQAQLDGVVASLYETRQIRELWFQSRIVVPGIRWGDAITGDDQERIATPDRAVLAGATDLVVGRALMRRPDTAQAYQELMTMVESANQGK
ncbi:MAG: orotidine-5'-phosphate decarboxylase [Firmicutes bacterium]|nr:orotidine-5'-phosphate decarboxylase [Bacillota bacterium]MCL5971660.1 orotidine-5'-phosphate decarboxylase [Bacillota bacterium]